MNHFSYLIIVLQIIISIFNISIIYFSSSKEVYIDIDNQISEIEDNIDYSNFSAETKLLALYLPKINYEEKKFNINQNDQSEYSEYQKLNIEEFQNQIILAKSHGVYGLAIYYYWFIKKQSLENPLNLFLRNKSIDFNFMLILEYNNLNFTQKIEKTKEFHVKNK